MKIGIITLPLHTNYGGILQSFALMKVLKGMGHDVWSIDRRYNKTSKWRHTLHNIKQIITSGLNYKKYTPFLSQEDNGEIESIIGKHTHSFIKKYLSPQTQKAKSTIELKDVIEKNDFEAIIVGSDQVWRPKYAPEIKDYFLNFLNERRIKRISYAASFGNNEWGFTKMDTYICKKAVKKFDAISVRESTGIDICKKHFDVDAIHVLDPTMLLSKEDYLDLIKLPNKDNIHKGLLVYILDETEDKNKVIDIISEKYKYVPFRTNSKTENNNATVLERIAPPVEDWVKGFDDAEYIITDSFHACVFSILFNKPFLVYANKNRGLARFESLLSMFNLESRLITSFDKLCIETIEETIDWVKVNKILDSNRQMSLDFLKSNLV